MKLRLHLAENADEGGPVQPFVEIFDEFLEWCLKHKSPRTFEWYRNHIRSFIKHEHDGNKFKSLTVAALKPIHVERWVDAHPTWGVSHQRGAKIAVQRAFRWAERMGIIAINPVRFLPKPEQGKHDQVITPDQQAMIITYFNDHEFRTLLRMTWHTGARPQECVRIEARHVELENRRIVLPRRRPNGRSAIASSTSTMSPLPS